jgi:hypothetical protein
MMPKLPKREGLVRRVQDVGLGLGAITWISCLTIGAKVVSRHIVEEILQDFFIARLLALAQSCRHAAVNRAFLIQLPVLRELQWFRFLVVWTTRTREVESEPANPK